MNEQIMKILPAMNECPTCKEPMVFVKSSYEQYQPSTYVCKKCKCEISAHKMHDRNSAINDCASAIEKANLVRCPTEKQIIDILMDKEDLLSDGYDYYSANGVESVAKALLALLRGDK